MLVSQCCLAMVGGGVGVPWFRIGCLSPSCSFEGEGPLLDAVGKFVVHVNGNHMAFHKHSWNELFLNSVTWADFLRDNKLQHCKGCGRARPLRRAKGHKCIHSLGGEAAWTWPPASGPLMPPSTADLGSSGRAVDVGDASITGNLLVPRIDGVSRGCMGGSMPPLASCLCFDIPQGLRSPDFGTALGSFGHLHPSSGSLCLLNGGVGGSSLVGSGGNVANFPIFGFGQNFGFSNLEFLPAHERLPFQMLIDSVDVHGVLHDFTPCLEFLPKRMLGLFNSCCNLIFVWLSVCPGEAWPWRLFYKFPTWCLRKSLEDDERFKRLNSFSLLEFGRFYSLIGKDDKLSRRNGAPLSSRSKHDVVSKLVHQGLVGKAMDRLVGGELVDIGPQQLDVLDGLHPPSSWSLSDEDSVPFFPSQEVSLEDVVGSVKQMKVGVSSGPSGWLNGHFKAMVEDVGLMDVMSKVVNHVVMGRVHSEGRVGLLASRLVGGPKGGGGVRPIAMGETFVKLVEKSLMKGARPLIESLFPKSQFGVCKSFGTEMVVHSVRRRMERGDHVLSLDVRNAFNSVGRETMYRCVLEKIPSFLSYFCFAYGSSSPLIVDTQMGVRELLSFEGVRQGAPLSGFFFCLAINDLLLDVGEMGGVEVYSYADDMNFCSQSLEDLELIYSRLELELGVRGLSLRPDKSKLFLSGGDVSVDGFAIDGVEKVVDGIVICGCPLGSDSFVEGFLRKKELEIVSQLASIVEFRGCFDRSSLFQESFTLFRSCIVTKLGYLLRVLNPDVPGVAGFFAHMWDVFMDWLAALLGFDGFDDVTRQLWSFPVVEGGGGIAPFHETCHLSYFSSYISCLMLYGGDVDVDEEIRRFRGCNDGFDEVDFRGRYLQGKLTSIWMGKRMELFFQENDALVVSRLVGSKGKGSFWIFSKGDSNLSQFEFLICISLRFGLMLPFGLDSEFHELFDGRYDEASQLLGISVGGGVIARHNRMERVLKKWLVKAGWSVGLEPLVGGGGGGDRADLVLSKLGVSHNFYLDLTFVCSTMVSYVKRVGSKKKVFNFGGKRKRKLDKYVDLVKGVGGYFVPIVIDTLGRLDEKVYFIFKEWLRDLKSGQMWAFWKEFAVEMARMRVWTLERVVDVERLGCNA